VCVCVCVCVCAFSCYVIRGNFGKVKLTSSRSRKVNFLRKGVGADERKCIGVFSCLSLRPSV
jgi:hypothetical protein